MSKKNTRTVIGQVVSDGMQKTAAVKVTHQRRHPLYSKYIRRTTKILVHDEEDRAKVGDQVVIRECRPLSKNKSWELVEVLESNESVALPDEPLASEVKHEAIPAETKPGPESTGETADSAEAASSARLESEDSPKNKDGAATS